MVDAARKSTLLLQNHVLGRKQQSACYVGEESLQQVAMRAKAWLANKIKMLSANHVDAILTIAHRSILKLWSSDHLIRSCILDGLIRP